MLDQWKPTEILKIGEDHCISVSPILSNETLIRVLIGYAGRSTSGLLRCTCPHIRILFIISATNLQPCGTQSSQTCRG